MVERAPLSPKDVVISRTVAKFGNTSYPINPLRFGPKLYESYSRIFE
jgi:hypothetical protein